MADIQYPEHERSSMYEFVHDRVSEQLGPTTCQQDSEGINKTKTNTVHVSDCPHGGEFERAPNAASPRGSPGLIIAITIAARTRRLPLMPHYRNWRTGRDGDVRAQPGASASARLARRQEGHGRCRSALFAWECGTVACMIYCDWASVMACVYVWLLGIA
jgi:hypothetical protein